MLPQIKVFSKKIEVITCLAAICADRGNVDSIQVARSNRRATYGDYRIPTLQFLVNCFFCCLIPKIANN